MTGEISTAPRLLALIAATLALAGCGQAGTPRPPTAADLPLAGGARIITRARQCDKGVSAYCAVEFVVVDDHYRNSTELVAAEDSYLRAHGWTAGNGDFGTESAADSPGHRLRLTYAGAQYDLEGVDLGWTQRSRKITAALSSAVFDRAPAISLMLETGSS